MNTTPSNFGNTNVAPSPLSVTPSKTLLDLLTALEGDKYYPMLRTTAGHIASCLKVPVEQIAIDVLVDVRPSFRQYLKDHHYKNASIRSYSNYAAMLVHKACQMGWASAEHELPSAWSKVVNSTPKHWSGDEFIRYAVQIGKVPAELTDDDLNACCQTLLDRGRSYEYVAHLKSRFRRALRKSGVVINSFGNGFGPERPLRYGIPVHALPAQLRKEVEELLQWKQETVAEDRPGGPLSEPTARSLEGFISRLAGFAFSREKRTDITSLAELITKASVYAFSNWSLKERALKRTPFRNGLRLLRAALRHYPKFPDHELNWLRSLIAQIKPDSEEEKRERKRKKFVPYPILLDIEAKIHAQRNQVKNLGTRALAWLVHDELLFSFLVTLVWRQRNLRECKIGHNVSKGEIPPMSGMKIPRWASKEMMANPHAEFWQFYFREDETKSHHEVRSLLPHRLVPLLEEYLQQHRPLLLAGPDQGFLFLNRRGGQLTQSELCILVSDITLEHAGRRVTPHLFRDIFAHWWLESHPEDYLSLSKVLWHCDIKTTLRIYGARFDESHGLCRVEEYLDKFRPDSGNESPRGEGAAAGALCCKVPKRPAGSPGCASIRSAA